MIDAIADNPKVIAALVAVMATIAVKVWWDRRNGGPRGRR